MRARKDRAPNRMSVQDRAGIHAARDGEMEQGFSRRPAFATHHVTCSVHLQELRGRKAALVQSRRSNREAQRLAGNHRAEVSTRTQDPSARVKVFSNPSQISSDLREPCSLRLLDTHALSGGK